jgi:membrane associated rhomboid family serine protease
LIPSAKKPEGPAGDSGIPVATLILIAANILAAFLLMLQPELLDQFGYLPSKPSAQSALASLFLHQNLLHLLGNMVFLAAVGAAVELATGAIRFVVVYFSGGLAGILAYHFAAKSQDVPPLVGASGCIAACAAYYTSRYVSLRVPIAPRIGVPVLGVTLLWLLLQFAGAFIRTGGESGTSYWAHIGGFAAGLLLVFTFRAPDLGHARLGHEVLDRMNARSPAAALSTAERHLEDHPNDVRVLREVAALARQIEDEERETKALHRLLSALPETEHYDAIMRLRELRRLQEIAPLQRMLMADRYKAASPQLSRVLLLSVVEERASEPQRPEALLALAGLEMESDELEARRHLDELERRHPMHPAVDIARKRGWLA